jgi:hypothetical protein
LYFEPQVRQFEADCMDKPKGSSPDPFFDGTTPSPIAQSEATQTETLSWREVAALAAKESDPNRLAQLVDELIRLLDEERQSKSLRPLNGDGR